MDPHVVRLRQLSAEIVNFGRIHQIEAVDLEARAESIADLTTASSASVDAKLESFLSALTLWKTSEEGLTPEKWTWLQDALDETWTLEVREALIKEDENEEERILERIKVSSVNIVQNMSTSAASPRPLLASLPILYNSYCTDFRRTHPDTRGVILSRETVKV